jgi:large exoprotein involved in heme utilization and adhesion
LKVKHAEIPCLAFGFSFVLLFGLTSFAQTVSPITSSGLNTRVSPPSTLPSGKVQYDITGGTRPGGGGNLFHSFGESGVPNNNIATFVNNIDPQFVVLQNSQILAQAVQGPGGNISITTNLLLPDSTSLISASSQFGQQGTIIIQSPISPASGKIVPLGQKPLIATTLLSQRCAALAGGKASSFTVAGRDSLPAEPGGWLSSPLALETAELVGSTATEPETRTSLRESMEAMPVVSLRRMAPPGFLIQSFATDWSAGCAS